MAEAVAGSPSRYLSVILRRILRSSSCRGAEALKRKAVVVVRQSTQAQTRFGTPPKSQPANRRRPPRQVRPRLSPRRSLTEHARQSSREHSHNRQHDIASAARFPFQLSPQRGGSGSGKSIKISLRSAACPARPTSSPDCGCGAILLFDRRHPSVPTCARDMPARAAAVKDGPSSATAPAARSVLDGREHDGRLDRVGAAISLSNKQTIKRRPRKTIKK